MIVSCENVEPNSASRKNRNRFQISQAILEVARAGAGKTRIMYRANLSFKLLKHYLTVLVKSGLIRVEERERKLYLTTEKGLRFLREFEALEEYATIVMAKRNELDRMLEKGAS